VHLHVSTRIKGWACSRCVGLYLKMSVDRLRINHRRASAALFNASNHEYFTIPAMVNVFDPALAVRVTSFQSAVWEQGMTLCMWLRFLTLDDAWQTLFEMSNGYATEHVYVRRYADTPELLFGVIHSGMKKEMVTAPSSLMGPTLVANTWTHVCWVVQHPLSLYSNATASNNSLPSSYYIVPQSLLQWASYSTSYASSTLSVGIQAMASYNASWTTTGSCPSWGPTPPTSWGMARRTRGPTSTGACRT